MFSPISAVSPTELPDYKKIGKFWKTAKPRQKGESLLSIKKIPENN